MYDDNDVLTGADLERERAQRSLDALTDANYRTSDATRGRTAREIASLQEQLQVLADSPQLRHRLGYSRVSVALPFADSRRPTDPTDGSRQWVMDYAFSARDADRNYAAGLL